MKPKFPIRRQFLPTLIAAGCALACTITVQATDKAATGTDLNDDASWDGGAIPTPADIATWTATSLGTALTLSSATSWLGIDTSAAVGDIDNGVEYFMGQTGSSFTANPGPVAGKITWPKDPAFSGSYVVQTSDTMEATDWDDIVGGDPNLVDSGNSVEYTLPTGQGKLFVRIQVTPN